MLFDWDFKCFATEIHKYPHPPLLVQLPGTQPKGIHVSNQLSTISIKKEPGFAKRYTCSNHDQTSLQYSWTFT